MNIFRLTTDKGSALLYYGDEFQTGCWYAASVTILRA